MSSNFNDGLEYISTTKRKLKSQLQDKGISVTDSTPFGQYPEMLGSELKSKSWQYPTTWYQLTPKAEFPEHSIEMVLFDSPHDFRFYIEGEGELSITMYGKEGETYELDGVTYNLNETYIVPSGYKTVRLKRGSGAASIISSFTTLKMVMSFSSRLIKYHPYHFDTLQNAELPVLALRAKDSTSFSKEIYFHYSKGTLYDYRGKHSYMQYCDLSMVHNLRDSIYQFFDCPQLVKVELPDGFSLSNYAFKQSYNLREVIGLDYTSYYYSNEVFCDCYSFVPPKFNYLGDCCYKNTNVTGLDISLSETSIGKTLISLSPEHNEIRLENGEIGGKYRLTISKDTMYFNYYALGNLNNNCILNLPSNQYCWGSISSMPQRIENITPNLAAINSPYLIENGENFYTSEYDPLSLNLTPYYGGDEVNLPNVPLLFLCADCPSPKGRLKRVNFDWGNTNFVEYFADSVTGYVIDIRGNQFDHDSLVELFYNLPTLTSVTRNIRITDNPGVSELTDDEIAIVIDKGYILVK